MEMKSSNPNALKDLQVRLKQLAGVQGKVGWFESSKYEDGTPVAYVATIQEFGHGPIPPRLGMRTTASNKRGEWAETAGRASREVLKGNLNSEQAMDLLTMKAEGDVSKHIASVTEPPLSPITLLARAYRAAGKKVTGKTIGEIAGIIKNDPDKAAKMASSVSAKPLIDTRQLFDTLTHVVEKT